LWNSHFVDTFICNQNTRFLPWIIFLPCHFTAEHKVAKLTKE